MNHSSDHDPRFTINIDTIREEVIEGNLGLDLTADDLARFQALPDHVLVDHLTVALDQAFERDHSFSRGFDELVASVRDAALNDPQAETAFADAEQTPDEAPPGTPSEGNLLWIDVETTGLPLPNPVRRSIDLDFEVLEVAAVVTNADFQVLERTGSLLLTVPEEALGDMSPTVVQMHTDSGLLHRLSTEPTLSRAEVDGRLVDLVERHFPPKVSGGFRGAEIAGQSVGGFDRLIVSAWFPGLDALCSHRVFDASTLRALVGRQCPGVDVEAAVRAAGATYDHSAVNDVEHSILLARQSLRVLRGA